MYAFERRHYSAEDLHQIPSGGTAANPLYAQVIAIYPDGLPGVGRLSTDAIIRVMDAVLGTDNTQMLLRGNTPTVLMTAGNLIEDQLRLTTVPNKDLQLNLLVNILKESAYVENVPPAMRLVYLNEMLGRTTFPQDFKQRVVDVLNQNGSMDVPWAIIEIYEGMAVLA